MNSHVQSELERVSNLELSKAIVEAFVQIEQEFYLKHYQTSELQSGHFVEAIRRFIELKLFGSYPPIGQALSPLSPQQLQRYENGSGEESYRIIIPRALFAIFSIRNKRGIGHLSQIAANRQDAIFILSTCKWILSELLRIESGLSPNQTVAIVDQVLERTIEGVWDIAGKQRILVHGLKLKEKILFLLFSSENQTSDTLFASIEYKDRSYFQKVLRELHSEREIELLADGTVHLSPIGRRNAEKIVLETSA